jgi:transcription elongation factor Elf1
MKRVCTECGSERLVRLSTCKLEGQKKPGYLECGDCHHRMPWQLDEGQKPLIANNRLK